MGCLHLGLTGGIGSGKSTVAALLASFGASLIDADTVARELTSSGGAAIPAIRDELGASFLTADGALNREVMREKAFADPSLRRALEGIVHPLVRIAMDTQATSAIDSGSRMIVFDIPLLVESGRWRNSLDKVLVIDCDVETQVQRVTQRSRLTRDSVLAIVASQATRLQRTSCADLILCNQDMNLAELKVSVGHIAAKFGL